MHNHLASRHLSNMGILGTAPSKAKGDADADSKNVLLDAAGAAASFAANSIRDAAVSAINIWAGTPVADLDEGEALADRLEAMAIGIADENKDGEITDDEADVIEVALNAMADYLISQGATEEDAVALLADKDAEAASRVHELLGGSSASDDDIDNFLFDAETSAAVMDGILDGLGLPTLDAVYKKKVVVRKGKKVRINKRVSGTVRLSAGQKVAIRKASLKANSATARMRRVKSNRVRENAGLNK